MYTDQPLQSFDMGYSRTEFDGVMRLQQSVRFEITGTDTYRLFWQDMPIDLRLGEAATRRIASMQMSLLPVSMDLSALPQTERKPFLKAFFKSFLKGGG